MAIRPVKELPVRRGGFAANEYVAADMREFVRKGMDVTLWGVDYMPLPVDADDVPIHVGDAMEWCDSGDTLEVIGIGDDTIFYIDRESDRTYAEWTAARNKRHHHAPTVEDVLQELTDEVWNRCCEGATASDSGIDELVAEYAAKLRLAGEDA